MNWMNLFVSAACAEGATVPATPGAENVGTAAALISSLLPMVLIIVVFYFMLIRPQRKKDKQVRDMLSALKPGDRICTIGGIYGTITGIKDDKITLVVGRSDVPMTVARWAIRSVEEVTIENDGEALN